MEDDTYVACSMHILKKKGIQILLRKLEQEEPLWSHNCVRKESFPWRLFFSRGFIS